MEDETDFFLVGTSQPKKGITGSGVLKSSNPIKISRGSNASPKTLIDTLPNLSASASSKIVSPLKHKEEDQDEVRHTIQLDRISYQIADIFTANVAICESIDKCKYEVQQNNILQTKNLGGLESEIRRLTDVLPCLAGKDDVQSLHPSLTSLQHLIDEGTNRCLSGLDDHMEGLEKSLQTLGQCVDGNTKATSGCKAEIQAIRNLTGSTMSLLQNLKPELATKTELDKVKDTLVKQQDQILEIAKASDLKTVLLLNKLTELGMLMTQIGPTVSGLAGQVNILQQSMIRVENRLQKLGSPFGVVESQDEENKKLIEFNRKLRSGNPLPFFTFRKDPASPSRYMGPS